MEFSHEDLSLGQFRQAIADTFGPQALDGTSTATLDVDPLHMLAQPDHIL